MEKNIQSEMLEAILEAAVDAIITIDSNGVVQTVNQSAIKLFGYEREQFLNRNISFLMPEPWASEHDAYLAKYQKTGERKIIGIGREVEGLRTDGTTFPMHLSVSEFEVSGKTYYTGILHDMTSRKRAEDALHRSQRMEAIGQLTGGIAHDFNNLLTIITGNLELLSMRLEDDSHKEFLNDAREAAEHGADLTERLLAFARRSVLTPEVVNLNTIIKTTKSMLARTLGENIDIETSLDHGLWDALVDPGQIESVILNLAVNARDAMTNGGKLLIETKNIQFDSKYVETEIGLKPGRYVSLSVSDTGHGMSEAVRDNAFEPFFTTKEKGRGTGLGLSMVYGFAKQSGGHATIYSELGMGSTINIYVPRYDGIDQPKKVARRDDLEIVSGNNETILIVEDDPKVRAITVSRIKSLNYKVIVTNNGTEAIAALQNHNNIDLVFTDLVMPGDVSGYDLVEHVLENFPQIPVLMTSGYAEDLLGNGKLASLNVELLRKPYRQADLSEKLSEAIHSKRKSID
ncbi:MAG: PAS domain S-box protein [Rhizobiaceae bacterium]|nr:PAS domain S-box protein [Rhizobiaceae bacterium]